MGEKPLDSSFRDGQLIASLPFNFYGRVFRTVCQRRLWEISLPIFIKKNRPGCLLIEQFLTIRRTRSKEKSKIQKSSDFPGILSGRIFNSNDALSPSVSVSIQGFFFPSIKVFKKT